MRKLGNIYNRMTFSSHSVPEDIRYKDIHVIGILWLYEITSSNQRTKHNLRLRFQVTLSINAMEKRFVLDRRCFLHGAARTI